MQGRHLEHGEAQEVAIPIDLLHHLIRSRLAEEERLRADPSAGFEDLAAADASAADEPGGWILALIRKLLRGERVD